MTIFDIFIFIPIAVNISNICRARVGKIPDRRASLSGRKSSLEKAMRNFADKKSGTVHKPEISEEFDSLDEAYDFYNLYSWETGFGIKYGQCRRNMDKCKTVQDMVFGCQVVNIFDSRHVNLAVLQGRVHFAIVLM